VTVYAEVSGFGRHELAVFRYLLHPYDIKLNTETDRPDLMICRGPHLDWSGPIVSVPVDSHSGFSGSEVKFSDDHTVELPFDLVSRCVEKFEAAMNPKVAFTYRLATRLPFQYNIVPSSIRSWFLRTNDADSDLSKHLANDAARKIVVKAFDLLGFHLKRKNPPSLLITHDIDSEKGLRRAFSFKAAEDELNIKSTWFLPSDEFSIPRTLAKDLVDGSTIGSHDIKHDGRLVHIRRHDELVQRLSHSRSKLEDLFETEVTCFRAPLLQFSERIMSALAEAGYSTDFSAPCWEPVHPSTMGGFGVETSQAFETNGVLEVPSTLFQDHQVLNVLCMDIDGAIKLWTEQARLIRSFEGDIVLVTHPHLAFSENLQKYRNLLTILLHIDHEMPEGIEA